MYVNVNHLLINLDMNITVTVCLTKSTMNYKGKTKIIKCIYGYKKRYPACRLLNSLNPIDGIEEPPWFVQ